MTFLRVTDPAGNQRLKNVRYITEIILTETATGALQLQAKVEGEKNIKLLAVGKDARLYFDWLVEQPELRVLDFWKEVVEDDTV